MPDQNLNSINIRLISKARHRAIEECLTYSIKRSDTDHYDEMIVDFERTIQAERKRNKELIRFEILLVVDGYLEHLLERKALPEEDSDQTDVEC